MEKEIIYNAMKEMYHDKEKAYKIAEYYGKEQTSKGAIAQARRDGYKYALLQLANKLGISLLGE